MRFVATNYYTDMDDRQAALTALGLILSVLIAYLQVQRNARAALALQETHLQNELKLKLYEKIGVVLSDANDQLSKAGTQYFSVLSSLDLRVRKQIPVDVHDTGLALSAVVHEAQRRLSRVLNLLEEYEIVFLRFGSFRRQLVDEHRKLLSTHQEFWTQLLPYLPFVHNTTKQQLPSPIVPTAEQLDVLEQRHRAFQEVCNDVGGYLIDLQIETQNELLGDLLQRQVPPRSPLDPTVAVLRRDENELVKRPPGRLI